MKNVPNLKHQLMELAANSLDEFLHIIGDIGYDGYKIYKYQSRGNSLQKTALKFKVTKRKVQHIVQKCNKKGYGSALFKLNMLN